MNVGFEVAGTVVVCAGADDADALLAALESGQGGIRPDPGVPAPHPGGPGQVPAFTARARAAEDAADGERIGALVNAALDHLLEDGPPAPGARLRLVLPPADTPRGRAQDPGEWIARLRAEPAVEDMAPSVEHQSGPVAAHLQAACAALAAGEAEEIVFGAADSLLDPVTTTSLARRGLLETSHGTGVIPGEAAVFLRLRRAGDHAAGPLVGAIALAEEPHAGRPHLARQTGLARAMADVLGGGAAGLAVHAAGIRRLHLLEWHQARTDLWPPVVPEGPEEPPPAEPQALNLGLVTGDTGAAGLPLGLAAACAALAAGRPGPAVVCEWEAPPHPGRAAVALHGAPANPAAEQPAPAAATGGDTP